MNQLDELRLDIEKVDKEMCKLFVQRMQLVEKVAEYKIKQKLPIVDKNREHRILEKLKERLPAKHQNLGKYIEAFVHKNLELSKEYQKEIIENKNQSNR